MQNSQSGNFNNSGRTSNAAKNIVSAFSNKLIILIFTFVRRKVFIDYIGVAYLGISGLFSNVLTLLSLADMGLETAMNVSLYKPVADKDAEKLSAYIGFYRILYRIIAIAILCLGLLLIPFLKYIVNMEQEIPNLYLYYVLFVVKTAVSYLFVYKRSIIRADQRTYLINKV